MTERVAQDAAVEAAAGRQVQPEPGGLAGRAARAHDAGDAALAKALTDAALAEPEEARG
jgi:hypothetical protein